MFDPRTEPPITFAEACKLPWLRTRKGRINIRTMHRWASFGKSGVRLEVVKMGGARFTSEAALVRFFEHGENITTGPTAAAMDADRARAVAEAKARLAAAGI